VLRTGNTVSTESVTAPWSLGARSERTRRVRERRETTRAGMQGRSNASVFPGRCTKECMEGPLPSPISAPAHARQPLHLVESLPEPSAFPIPRKQRTQNGTPDRQADLPRPRPESSGRRSESAAPRRSPSPDDCRASARILRVPPCSEEGSAKDLTPPCRHVSAMLLAHPTGEQRRE